MVNTGWMPPSPSSSPAGPAPAQLPPARPRPSGRAPRLFSPWRRVAMALWGVWEGAFVRVYRLYEIPGDHEHAMRIGFRRWHGPQVVLEDGETVQPGDWIGEVHISSPRFARAWEAAQGSPAALVGAMLRELRRGFQAIARELAAGRFPVPVKAFYGETLLHRGIARLGFETREVPPGVHRWWLTQYEAWLMRLYHPQGGARLVSGGQKPELKYIWLSTRRLMERYGTASPTPTP